MSAGKLQPKLKEPAPGEWLDPEDFARVVCLTPLVALDLIVRSSTGAVLVGRRTNQPAKGSYFVPGSRITKNERISAAFERICREELGCRRTLEGAKFLGAYEHLYEDNRFGQPGYGTHYITLAYEFEMSLPVQQLPPDQHDDYRWMTVPELLARPDVHSNTKAYFTSR